MDFSSLRRDPGKQLAGLSLCRFKPGSFDGKPEESWAKMRYDWKLDG